MTLVRSTLSFVVASCVLLAAEPNDTPGPAPKVDRVGFPTGYAQSFQILRTNPRKDEFKVVTVYGNAAAASITNLAQLPYPNGSIIVMETASVQKDATGKAVVDVQGQLIKDAVLGLHVMRRGPGFGEAYQTNRTAEWEYVEYRPDGTYLTPPEKSATCAACHVKAGAQKDFVYHGRFSEASKP
ncbi:MAG TPA: cytochrome P460 family protein [Verrucomicrobiota bacterium]|nr:hypothetical protein [Verrucomicrobiales bacterium]HRI15970.1 cytochrome P460 family protein [Verrucomicrobiota bacterium]